MTASGNHDPAQSARVRVGIYSFAGSMIDSGCVRPIPKVSNLRLRVIAAEDQFAK
jgi:hypothetical protein